MSRRIGFIHSYAPAAIIFSINGLYHFPGSRRFYLDPTVHFLHIDATKHILVQITHVKDELKETGLIKTILCSEVDKKSFIIAIAETSSLRVTMNGFLSSLFSFLAEIKISSVFIILQKTIKFQRRNSL